MYDQLQKRLTELKAEFEKGQTRLNELEKESEGIKNTLLRISGAIQVLEEELNKNQEGQEGENDG